MFKAWLWKITAQKTFNFDIKYLTFFQDYIRNITHSNLILRVLIGSWICARSNKNFSTSDHICDLFLFSDQSNNKHKKFNFAFYWFFSLVKRIDFSCRNCLLRKLFLDVSISLFQLTLCPNYTPKCPMQLQNRSL